MIYSITVYTTFTPPAKQCQSGRDGEESVSHHQRDVPLTYPGSLFEA